MADDARREQEWLEADGLGGFASGTASSIRTRRYHALLLSASTPPTGRMVLVNGFDAHVVTEAGTYALTSQLYLPGVRHPDGESRIESFDWNPWPQFRFRLEDGSRLSQEVMAQHGRPLVAVRFALEPESRSRARRAELVLRPFLSGRDYHALHHENPAFRFDAEVSGERITWRPYQDVPAIHCLTNGAYLHNPAWYRNFLYERERERGLDFSEDLGSPGELRFDLSRGEAVLVFTSEDSALGSESASTFLEHLRLEERSRREAFPSELHRAADMYVVRRYAGCTIVAGYPWFTDWGRDTFIALRGLCLATGRLDEAESILLEWADSVSQGMLPNRFPDHGEEPEFNAVDASLWYVVAVEDFLQRSRGASEKTRKKLLDACQAILEGYSRGTRFGIHADTDGLLAAGQPGVQLTWMDARIGDWVVTPRIGKPVEVEALWLNALAFGSGFSKEWESLYRRGAESFEKRFWYPEGGYLHDVVDVDHVAGTYDASLRPNQILAIGGLLRSVLHDKKMARSVVDVVESRLWTPIGLRSLAPEDPRYVKHYMGGVRERDGSYHQGTAWTWLLGSFIEAWARVRGESAKVKKEARTRFLVPLLARTGDAGLGHLPEIADAEPPHMARGCPFQAWSVGEALRSVEYLEKAGHTRRERKKTPTPSARRRGRPSPPPSL